MPLFNKFINAVATLVNTKLGKDALISLTTGSDNVAVGERSLTANQSGNSNIGVGVDALKANVSGNNNICIGQETGQGIISGSSNVAIGYQALNSLQGTTKASNIAIGYQAGAGATGLGNICIGRSSNVSVAGRDFCIAIGREASAGDNANGELALGSAAYPLVTGTTAMTVGTAAALPGVPAGWLQVKLNGTYRKIPYWN